MLRRTCALAGGLLICAAHIANAAPCQPVWRPASGQPGANGPILALCVWDDGNGRALYVGGTFSQIGGLPISNLARWDGRHWSAVGGGTDGGVWALATYDDGDGEMLYVGGEFAHAGGVSAANVARWDGFSFSPLGTGIVAMPGGPGNPGIAQHPAVDALVVFDDGGGPGLAVGGDFSQAGGVLVQGVALWRDGVWSGIGNGIRHAVNGAYAYDDGGGEALFVGGTVIQAGGLSGQTTGYMARWRNGWSRCNGGMDAEVVAFTPHDDGTGTQLYAGGLFGRAGGVTVENIARWNGSAWSPVGALQEMVFALSSFDDGLSSQLYAGGDRLLRRWNGTQWQSVAGGLTGDVTWRVLALEIYDDGDFPTLYIGGRFAGALKPGGSTLSVGNLVAWGCPFRRGDLNCDDAINFRDIDAFVAALGGDATYGVAFPNCHRELADLDRDGEVTFKDINPFVARLGH